MNKESPLVKKDTWRNVQSIKSKIQDLKKTRLKEVRF